MQRPQLLLCESYLINNRRPRTGTEEDPETTLDMHREKHISAEEEHKQSHKKSQPFLMAVYAVLRATGCYIGDLLL